MSALPYDPQGKASADATIVNKKISFSRNTMFPLWPDLSWGRSRIAVLTVIDPLNNPV